MIAKCADPERSQPFRVFRGGKLFIMDVDSSIWIRIASQCERSGAEPTVSCFPRWKALHHGCGLVDLDQNRQPVRTPALSAWALPENRRKGMRHSGRNGNVSAAAPSNGTNGRSQANGSNSPRSLSGIDFVARRINKLWT